MQVEWRLWIGSTPWARAIAVLQIARKAERHECPVRPICGSLTLSCERLLHDFRRVVQVTERIYSKTLSIPPLLTLLT